MRSRLLAMAATTALGAAVLAAPVTANAAGAPAHALFVQTNQLAGNAVQVYDQAANGTLTAAGLYPTGGDGGNIPSPFGLAGDVPLNSQDALTHVPGCNLLLAVNAGSNTITVFKVVHGDELTRVQVISSGGKFPNSIIARGNLVYVLNAGDDGSVAAFHVVSGRLKPVENGVTSLNDGNPDGPPPYTLAPSDIAISPDGSHVVVAFMPLTPAGPVGGWMDVFNLNREGQVASGVVQTQSAMTGPFGFRFTPSGDLAVVASSFDSGMEVYRLDKDGSMTLLSSAADGQVAGCWITVVNGFYYQSNTLSDTLSSFTINGGGQTAVVAADAADMPGGGPIDSAGIGDYLYITLGIPGEVIGYQVHGDGSLTQVTLVTGLPKYDTTEGMEGMASD